MWFFYAAATLKTILLLSRLISCFLAIHNFLFLVSVQNPLNFLHICHSAMFFLSSFSYVWVPHPNIQHSVFHLRIHVFQEIKIEQMICHRPPQVLEFELSVNTSKWYLKPLSLMHSTNNLSARKSDIKMLQTLLFPRYNNYFPSQSTHRVPSKLPVYNCDFAESAQSIKCQ